jgi:hypothetical protein
MQLLACAIENSNEKSIVGIATPILPGELSANAEYQCAHPRAGWRPPGRDIKGNTVRRSLGFDIDGSGFGNTIRNNSPDGICGTPLTMA